MIGLFLTYPPSIGETSLACDPAAGIGIRFAPPFLSSYVAAFRRLGKVSEVREGQGPSSLPLKDSLFEYFGMAGNSVNTLMVSKKIDILLCQLLLLLRYQLKCSNIQ